ncbi:GreA/GreB family elongation factor [Sphingosinicella terrae]|uniref:GreA/GreB family elongation factor n=1 Tax=Sphingosinicella terrae TaxID=2172047 RepID=UPI000E0DA95B|nr:GreA/GreB family elongation factor [Sphingosinicella terrae]
MSRAFVKDESDAPPPPPLERTVSQAPNRVTPRGARLIEAEIARLEAALAQAPDAAAGALLQRDLRYWTTRRATAQLQQPGPAPTAAGFGLRVTLRRSGREQQVDLVGEDEAEPAQGRVAWTSPLARAIEAAEPGEFIELPGAAGVEEIEIVAVAPIPDEPNS